LLPNLPTPIVRLGRRPFASTIIPLLASISSPINPYQMAIYA